MMGVVCQMTRMLDELRKRVVGSAASVWRRIDEAMVGLGSEAKFSAAVQLSVSVDVIGAKTLQLCRVLELSQLCLMSSLGKVPVVTRRVTWWHGHCPITKTLAWDMPSASLASS